MAGKSFSFILSAVMLIIIGGWLIIAGLLPIIGIDLGYYSTTVVAVSVYIMLETGIYAYFMWYIYPLVGALAFVTGLMLFKGKGKGLGIILYLITLVLAVLGVLFMFKLAGYTSGDEIWEFFKNALNSGDILAAIGILLEPILIILGSALGLLLLIAGKADKASK